MTIRLLTVDDAEAFADLRAEALIDSPLAFGSSPEDDRLTGIAPVREHLAESSVTWTFGAFDPELVGTLGLYRDPKLKSAHKAHLWGMYVTPTSRGRGLAAALLHAAIEHARTLSEVTHLHLSVTTAAQAAQRLYEQAGFQIWGTESDSLSHDGHSVDEHHMVLRLEQI